VPARAQCLHLPCPLSSSTSLCLLQQSLLQCHYTTEESVGQQGITRKRTHRHAHTHTHTHTRAHMCTPAHYTHTHTHTLTHTNACKYTQTRTHTYTRTNTHILKHTHTYTYTNTHTRTHTRTHACTCCTDSADELCHLDSVASDAPPLVPLNIINVTLQLSQTIVDVRTLFGRGRNLATFQGPTLFNIWDLAQIPYLTSLVDSSLNCLCYELVYPQQL